MDLGATSRADSSEQRGRSTASGARGTVGTGDQAAASEPRPELVRSPTAEFDRLERAVSDLADQYAVLRQQSVELARALEERDQRIRELELQLRESTQRRVAIGERIDALIAELDRLEQQAERASSEDSGAAGGSSSSPLSSPDQGG